MEADRRDMPRFYLHLHDGLERIEDHEGSELPDLAAARIEALDSARQLWAAAILSRRDLSRHRFEIVDAQGSVLAAVLFIEALPFPWPRDD